VHGAPYRLPTVDFVCSWGKRTATYIPVPDQSLDETIKRCEVSGKKAEDRPEEEAWSVRRFAADGRAGPAGLSAIAMRTFRVDLEKAIR